MTPRATRITARTPTLMLERYFLVINNEVEYANPEHNMNTNPTGKLTFSPQSIGEIKNETIPPIEIIALQVLQIEIDKSMNNKLKIKKLTLSHLCKIDAVGIGTVCKPDIKKNGPMTLYRVAPTNSQNQSVHPRALNWAKDKCFL